MELTVIERQDDITHVALTGRLDATAAEEMDKRFSDVASGQNRPTIVDLSGIEFIASRGIALLFSNSKRLKGSGHKLVLLNPQGMVEGVLKSSKMNLVMPITYDLEDAIRVVRGGESTGAVSGRPKSPESRPAQQDSVSTAPGTTDSLRLAIKNELAELDSLNVALAKFLETHSVPARATYAVNLAVEELVVNVIRYAYVDDDPHTIDFELAIEAGQIVVRIVDDGRPFDPREGPEFNLHAEDRQVGGLGLVLVLDMVDALKYQRAGEKNRVEVRVSLAVESENHDEPDSAE